MKKKALISSILTIAICLSLIAGSTFALFTSESAVNVAITSGTVDVKAEIVTDSLVTTSMGVASQTNGVFANGGIASFDKTAKLDLTNVTPGDKATFDIKVTNNSNVDVQYRVKWDVDGELYEALVATADDETLVDNTTEWAAWKTTDDKVKTIKVAVELPVGTGNDFQNKTASIAFTVEAVQGNGIVTDITTVDELKSVIELGGNAELKNDLVLDETIEITEDVVLDLGDKKLTGNLVASNGANVIVENGTMESADASQSVIQLNGANATLNDVTIDSARHGVRVEGGILVINGGTYKVNAVEAGKTQHAINVGGANEASTVIINGGEFIGPKGTNADSGAALNVQANATAVIYGGTFTGGKNNTLASKTADGITVYGGEFDQDPSAFILDAAKPYMDVTSDGTLYTVAPKANSTLLVSADELAAFANAVNGTAVTYAAAAEAFDFKGEAILLTCDVDLAGEEWAPIGTSNNKFKGTFDGLGYTISNLAINAKGKSNQGLFGFTTDGAIKNVHVHNATVTGRLNVGVVAGTPYTSTYENIKVTGHVEVNGMSYVGGVFGKNVYANVTNVTVDVDEDSYVYANSVENGIAYRTYVGGVIGFMGEGGHTVSNVTSNIDVIGTTCDIGGIAGIAHYGNNFVNCSSSGDVTVTGATESGDAEEIGGIAGVWNNGGNDVIFNNCSFTGTLTANITEGVDLSDNTITGKAYSKSGAGKLIIDGVTVTSNVADVKEELKNGGDVTLSDDVTVSRGETESSSYCKTGVTLKDGAILDGQGNTLTVNGANGTWDCAIFTNGGTIKNLTVNGAFRGIFTGGLTSDLIIDNVVIDDVCYTVHADGEGISPYKWSVSNSTINGWTSFSNIMRVVEFNNCKFGAGTGAYKYAYMRPYAATVLTNCVFEEGYEVDTTRNDVVFVNCYVGDTLITADNVVELLGDGASKAQFPVETKSDKELFDALKEGKHVILTDDIKTESATVAPYGNKVALIQNGGVIDGQGNTLSVDFYGDDYGIMTSGGTIKNLIIDSGCRAIVIMSPTEDIILENVHVSGDILYPINTAEHAVVDGVDLIVTNSSFGGWSSFAGVASASFTDCDFVFGDYGYGWPYESLVKPYVNTTFTNCTFNTENGEGYYIDLSSLGADCKVTLANCTVDGVVVTAENCTELFGEVELPSGRTLADCIIFA